ncbi:FYVE zinc finger-domain-containing protein [Mrakia frigida]|uniref:phosphatidylinositol-3-phosphate binding protein n=1 Tax=Mrakia frigida TaxID=29902 RepID=UPI003FCBFA6B
MTSINGASSSQAGPSTLSPPLHRTSSSPNPTIHPASSTSRLLPRPKLPSPSHSSTEPSTRPSSSSSRPITTRSLGPATSRRPTSFHSSTLLNPTQPRPRLASSGSAHLPTSVSLNNLEPPPPPGSENSSRRGSPKPNHRPSSSAPFNFLDNTPLPSPSIFASNAGSRRSSFLGSTSGEQSEGTGAAGQVVLGAGGGKTLYRAGFQPKGVWRARTGEFVEVRMRREEGRRGEERRLGRRLEKLIELHFSPVKAPVVPPPPPPPKAPPRRSSSAFSLDFESLKNPGDLWRGLKERSVSTSSGLGGNVTAESKRAAEQGIVKWEEDSTVKKCPICTSSFNLANRKHHCRLCGRVVCALPSTPVPLIPTTSNPRKETCSLLIVADWKSGRCEEVEEGFVGWLKVEGGLGEKGGATGGAGGGEMKVQGVRVCRDCWSVVSRRQYLLDATRVPAFTKLYEALRLLQQDIEDSLPEFRELLLNLQAPSATPPSPSTEKEASLLRLSLLETFAAYDSLSKRIRSLPCEKGSGQDRLQKSIAGASAAFIQREMAPLQVLPKLKKKGKPNGNSKLSSDDGLLSEVQLDSVLAMTLQPLLEQEAQLESFIRDAESQRKFEDASSLKLSLAEIRQEVQKILAGTS